MRPNLTMDRCFQKPLWVSSHWPGITEAMGGTVIRSSWGELNQTQCGSTCPHLLSEANSQKRPWGIQDRNMVGKVHASTLHEKKSCTFFETGSLALCGPG